MAKGKTHDWVNIVFNAVMTGFLLGIGIDWKTCLFFSTGHLFSTLFFGPDTDIMPKKRSGILAFFIYPYSILSKHRGISHSIWFGTLSRIFYGFIVWTITFEILVRFHMAEHGDLSPVHIMQQVILHFSWDNQQHQYLFLFFLGMFLADLKHILVDRISSFLKGL